MKLNTYYPVDNPSRDLYNKVYASMPVKNIRRKYVYVLGWRNNSAWHDISPWYCYGGHVEYYGFGYNNKFNGIVYR